MNTATLPSCADVAQLRHPRDLDDGVLFGVPGLLNGDAVSTGPRAGLGEGARAAALGLGCQWLCVVISAILAAAILAINFGFTVVVTVAALLYVAAALLLHAPLARAEAVAA